MLLVECIQGSEKWLQARCGVITASRFRDALDTTQKGNPTAKSELYAAQVAVERISGQPCNEGFQSWQMKRGQEQEPFGRLEYEASTGNLAIESGVALTDDRLFGFSTDGFIGQEGIIEIKSLVSAIALVKMWSTRDLSEYMHQCQGGLWITGRKWVDFVMFCPQLESIGKQLFIERISRDDNFIEQMEADLMTFAARVKLNEMELRKS